jgi:hypothetical protein
MADVQLAISPAQRELLVRVLSEKLKGKRVEVHRSEFSREFRHQLEAEQAEIENLLEKLGPVAAAS